MTDLVLVRHAETIWHAENRYAGVSDVALTATGHEQAKLLSKWAATAGLAAIWTSPLSRCRLTTAPSAAATGLSPKVDDRLRELDFGSLDGKTKSEAQAAFPEIMDAYLRDPVANHFHDGEPPLDAAARAIACLSDIATAHPEARVMVVAHSTLIRLALCRLLGIELTLYRSRFPRLLNCSLTEIRMVGGQAGFLSLNLPVESLVPSRVAALA
jgi:probable phosphoglycerate mutase